MLWTNVTIKINWSKREHTSEIFARQNVESLFEINSFINENNDSMQSARKTISVLKRMEQLLNTSKEIRD